MEQYVQRLTAVINTLQSLRIESSFDTMSKLCGCIQTLDGMIREIREQPETGICPAEEAEKDPDGVIVQMPEPEIEVEEIHPAGK